MKKLAIAALLPALLLTSSIAFAETGTTTATSTPSMNQVQRQARQVQRIQAQGDKQITARIASLNKLVAKIQALKKVSDGGKTAFSGKVQVQIDALTALKAKIDADTDLATLQTDTKSITISYRIFVLFNPQTEILVAVDRMGANADQLTAMATTLQASIQTAQTAGKDVAALQTALVDAEAKIADATTQSQNAENAVSSLAPDQGDKTVLASNTAALKSARAMLKTGTQDLNAANKDFRIIRQGLRTNKTMDSNSTSSTSH
jgi:vacuolar-type H+-ATPase subunit I/STV1